jgi:hypothetical protein
MLALVLYALFDDLLHLHQMVFDFGVNRRAGIVVVRFPKNFRLFAIYAQLSMFLELIVRESQSSDRQCQMSVDYMGGEEIR